MINPAQLMKQAQALKKNMADLQARLEATPYTGQAGGGMVEITLNGKGVAQKVSIKPAVVDAADLATLEDLIQVALNDAHTKMTTAASTEMGKLTGGLNIPGLF